LGEKAKLAGVRQFVFLSSMAVYGLAGEALLPGKEGLGGTQITGGTQPEPNTLYGKSKLAAEQALQALAAPSFLVSVLRPPLVYGPGCPGNYRRLRRLALGAPVFPALANQRSMIYIDHLCELIYLVLQQQAPGLFLPQNRAYVSTAGMAEAIAGRHGRKLNKKAWLNPWLKGLAGWTPAIPKAFCSLVYARELSGCFDWSYCMYSFEETMARTEGAPQ
jgi:UDP-glucose 4-epimerase